MATAASPKPTAVPTARGTKSSSTAFTPMSDDGTPRTHSSRTSVRRRSSHEPVTPHTSPSTTRALTTDIGATAPLTDVRMAAARFVA